MIIKSFIVNAIQENCYVLHMEGRGDAVVIDPGGRYMKEVKGYLEENNLKAVACLLTHGHFDHIFGIDAMREIGAVIYASEKEKDLLGDTDKNASELFRHPMTATADVYLKDYEKVTIAGIEFEMIPTPGHTVGSVCYYVKEEKVMFTGDTLFEGAIGRTDFATGSMEQMRKSLAKLMTYPENTVCYPGHNETTTIGDEKRNNPYM